MLNITEFLNLMPDLKASDLFVTAGKKPMFKIRADLEINKYMNEVTEEEIVEFRNGILNEDQKKKYIRHGNVDASYTTDKGVRFRINFFVSKSASEFVARVLPFWNLNFSDLGLPKSLKTFCDYPSGLVLICGAAGAGKTTTLSAMLDYINENYKYHIATIEDPIEYVHKDKNSLISQREIGSDVSDFETALNNALRVSPNVIIVGEMRSLESIEIAISAAMSGHLVISSIHTGNVIQCLQRICKGFSECDTQRVLLDLSLCLRGVIAQRLVSRDKKNGFIPAMEILHVTPLVSKYIASESISDIEDLMRSGSEEMTITFDRYLANLKNHGEITFEEGYKAASNKDEYNLITEGMDTGIHSVKAGVILDEPFDKSVDMKLLLKTAVYNKASDLILTAGAKPSLRINGSIKYLESGTLGASDTKRLLFSVLSANQRAMFEENREIDLALSLKIDSRKTGAQANSRFRINGFYQKGSVAVAIRLIPDRIPTPEELRLPKALINVINKTSGLILVTGPTGHGKSTTLASLIGLINQKRSAHIISIEDPIEYVHTNKESIIEQREVFADTKSYANGLKYLNFPHFSVGAV